MTDDANAPTVPESRPPADSARPAGAATSPDPRYALRTPLGKGGMGEVWLAHDGRIDRDIAIKLMRGGTGHPDAVARFLREARVQGRLEHPAIVPVHDLGDDPQMPFFAMKRLTGTTLADVLARNDAAAWPRPTLLARFVDICLAVEFAHQRGVVHRDLKPANIMLGDFGEAYVLDWGLARMTGNADEAVLRDSSGQGESGAGQTQAGAVMGTPGYMAPEQMRGEPVDHRTDVYALGCILFEILTGAPAIPRETPFEATLGAPHHQPTLVAPDIAPELDDACVRATARDRDARLPSARALADLVQKFLDGDRDTERRRALAATHLARAQQLFERARDRGGTETMSEAMREAGSAIALDPGNRDAQRLLARLLLDPPKTMPPEAARKVDDERQAAERIATRGAALAYLGFLIPLPVIYAFGVSRTWPLLMIAAEVIALAAFCGLVSRRRWRLRGAGAVAMVGMHCVLLASVAMIVGPLFLVPNLIFGSSTIMVTIPTVRIPKTIFAFHLGAIAVPLALEWIGVVPRSYSFVGNALVLEPWAVDMAPAGLLFTFLASIVLQLVANLYVLDAQRQIQDRAQEQLHVQAWQLAQLVPSSGSTP